MVVEIVCVVGYQVDVYEVKGLLGCKFLIVGKGGLNLIYFDLYDLFVLCYCECVAEVGDWFVDFDVDVLCVWVLGFGVEIYVGSLGWVFLVDCKVVLLLWGWVWWFKEQGVCLYVQYCWIGWDVNGDLCFDMVDGMYIVMVDVVVLVMGGGSWF